MPESYISVKSAEVVKLFTFGPESMYSKSQLTLGEFMVSQTPVRPLLVTVI